VAHGGSAQTEANISRSKMMMGTMMMGTDNDKDRSDDAMDKIVPHI